MPGKGGRDGQKPGNVSHAFAAGGGGTGRHGRGGGHGVLDAANFAQYKAGGGTDDPLAWEFSAGLDSWEKAPAPAQVGKRLYEGLLQKELAPELGPHGQQRDPLGLRDVLGGGVRGGGVIDRAPAAAGAVVRHRWCGCRVTSVLPLAKLYKPIWQYDAKTLAKDWSGHLAYGTGTSVAFTVLSGGAGLTAEGG